MLERIVNRILLVLLLVSTLAFALNIQPTVSSEPPETEWNKTYGGPNADNSAFVMQTSDGGYAVAGSTYSFGAGQGDSWLIKTDAGGVMQWNKTYGGTERDSALHVAEISDGGYALIGVTGSYIYLVKVDSTGNMQWNKTYGEGEGWYVAETLDNGYVLAGSRDDDFWLAKVDSFGNVQWSRTYGGTGRDLAYSAVQTSDGGYVIAGDTDSFTSLGQEAWLVKVDSSGIMQWNKTYGLAGFEGAYWILETSDGGYALAGYTWSFGGGEFDFWLVKTDSFGIMQWNKTYGGSYWEMATSFVETKDRGYVLAGFTESFGAGHWDVWVVRVDHLGNHQWNKTCGGASEDFANSIASISGGGYVLAGATSSFGAGDRDVWLIKVKPETPLVINATVEIIPNTLNLKSLGRLITAYVELPEGYNVSDIDVSTILLSDTIPAEMHPTSIGDEDNDGIPDLMVKFDRATVIEYVESSIDWSSPERTKPLIYEVILTVSGMLYDGTLFEGSDTVRLLKFLNGHPEPK